MKKLVIALLFGCIAGFTHAADVREESVEHAGAKFRVVHLEPKSLQILWKDASGQPYRTFDRVQSHLAMQGKTVKFLMNAGIFEPGGIPSGIHVESSKEDHPLNLAAGTGNFFLKPNGVFWIESVVEEAFIADAAGFQKRSAGLKTMSSRGLRLAVQSGPMLLIDGQRHPAFKDGSPNKLHRNGVGVDSKGRVVFAITAKGEEVNFWDFAGLFLKLDCRNALFLDGDISHMEVNPAKPVESNQFAAMFVVAE